MSDLIVFTYDQEDKAEETFKEVSKLKQENVQKPLIGIEDAVMVKNLNGKVKVQQTLEGAAVGSTIASGGLWGVLIGFLFGGPLFGALLGMGLGVLFGRRIDIGIDNTFVKDIGEDLSPGNSALFLLVKDTPVETVAEVLNKHGGRLRHTSLSDETAEAFRQASEHEEIRAAMASESSL